jgi:predicted transcriptional regulator
LISNLCLKDEDGDEDEDYVICIQYIVVDENFDSFKFEKFAKKSIPLLTTGAVLKYRHNIYKSLIKNIKKYRDEDE